MEMTKTLRKFIYDHSKDDLPELLLSASRYKDVDVKMAVGQIKARVGIKDKLTLWYNNDRLFFPSVLAVEQCSSEITAMYKQRFVQSEDCLCDLTGGLGVDTYFFSQKANSVIYVEKNEKYCDAAIYNLSILGVSNVRVINGDAIAIVTGNDFRISDANVYYIDPARRGEGNKRMFAVGDCEPDIVKIWSLLLEKRCDIIVKLSPMLDVTQVMNQLPDICELHIISVKNDCKELLVVARAFSPEKSEVCITCVNYISDGEEQIFRFYLSNERSATVSYATNVNRYLYEPNSSILKAGAYKSVGLHYGIKKIHTSSHLYTSDSFFPSFPGRIFEVTSVIPFSSRMCRDLCIEIPRANITVRNFPLSVEELRKRTRIVDGGDIYLFATTLSDSKKVIIRCHKV